jgi:nitric oxide reductase NorE protein
MSELLSAHTASVKDMTPARVRHVPGEAAIWVFVLGDMTMFAAFFGQFLWDRAHQHELFTSSARELSIAFGAINTLLLLTGSLFVVLGVHAVKERMDRMGSRLFAATFACAFVFGINKVLEYSSKLRAGYYPDSNDFFTYYYMYTGIHAVHLLIGMIFVGRMWQLSRRPQLNRHDFRFIEVGATYWHLVDLLWIVLFALLYLMV